MNHDRIMSYAKRRKAIIPAQGSQCHELLKAMFDGQKLTVGSAMHVHGVYALSQRCGELRRKYKWPVKSKTVSFVTKKGIKKVSQYWLEA